MSWRLRHENDDYDIQGGIDLRAVTTNGRVGSNPILLGCILRNLSTNAIGYTAPGGPIPIGCRCGGPETRIDAYDTGIGIPEDQLPRIFGSFTGLAPERSRGLGIGLSIVRRAPEVPGTDRSAIGCRRRVTFLDLHARYIAKPKLRGGHNWTFEAGRGRPSNLYIAPPIYT